MGITQSMNDVGLAACCQMSQLLDNAEADMKQKCKMIAIKQTLRNIKKLPKLDFSPKDYKLKEFIDS